MNKPNLRGSPLPASDLQSISGLLHSAGSLTVGKFDGLTVRSHFQPIFSVAHSRAVGFEGLMRPSDLSGNPLAPFNAFGRDFPRVQTVDRLASAVHVHNFQDLKADGWLFLNMNSEVFLVSAIDGNFLT